MIGLREALDELELVRDLTTLLGDLLLRSVKLVGAGTFLERDLNGCKRMRGDGGIRVESGTLMEGILKFRAE